MKTITVWSSLLSVVSTALAADVPDLTIKHEAGRCAIRGQCGKQGFFGKQLPCPDNGLAEEPSDDLRKQLVSVCGDEWADTKVCCTPEQVEVLESNLKQANSFIASCGACKKNFYDLFCRFTCSPDQSLFVNVTKTEPKDTKFIVTELDQLISPEFGTGFYNSCKDIKFGATGGKAMDFIGGGAKNYTQFVGFLGEKKLLGSPFQINFPVPNDSFEDMKPLPKEPIPCNSTEEQYRCSCVDCPGSCPVLPEVKTAEACTVGLLPCLSFAVVIIYSVLIALLVLAVSAHVAVAKRRKSNNERLQLLQDASPSDDEDEGDVLHGAGILDRPTRQYALNTYCDRLFSSLARTCARFPAVTIGSSIIIVGLLSLGWLRFALETEPVKLWVAPNSEAALEQKFFDENFGPFFRTEQAFLVNDTNPSEPGPVLSWDTLSWWLDVEKRVETLRSSGHGYTLKDVCYKPTGNVCVTQSVSGWFFAESASRENWQGIIDACAEKPTDIDCLPSFRLPLPAERLLGGYNRSSEPGTKAKAVITTWVIKNYNPGEADLLKAEEWEEDLKDLFAQIQVEAADRGLRLSFSTEISLEAELNKNTNTDAKIVVISYIVMFIYASLALGSTTVTIGSILRNPMVALVQSKFMLGIIGILIVLMSVTASIGLFAAAGVKATLIIAEVIPFLVLAVGVDNIFLIVHEFERVNISHADEPVSERVARALGRMGPSILLSATTETVAFALGAAVGMPAVRNFAAYAAGAVFFNAILQVTMFVAVLALNQERVEASRMDCVPCIKIKSGHSHHLHNGYGGAPFSGPDEEGFLSRFIRKYYAPAILGNRTRVAILTVFLGFFAAGIALLPEVELGLDQRIAIPSDSYLIKYFDDLYDYFEAGAPTYFVVKNLNLTDHQHQKQVCASFGACNELSLNNLLEMESRRPEISYIADSTASWIDDFFTWMSPNNQECCKEGPMSTCFGNDQHPWNSTIYSVPEGGDFVEYAKRWLSAQPDEDCPVAGQAGYSDAVVIDEKSLTIPASHFRTAHTPLTSQADFINAYASARRIAKDISEKNNIEVFPYSKFYVYFDQYASIVRLSTALVGAALAFILAITSLLLGSVATGVVITVTVLMIVVDIVGTMALAGVSLNAVSLVNIVICVGIGVEFCAHIARAFTIPSASILERAQHKFRGKDARAWAALVNVGGSVFSGITITKLLGVFVLAFTRSKIFEIYYFRIWLALVLWAALHALVFLPVALSLFGGRGYIDPESDGGLEQDLASRRYRALLPDEEYDSDDY